jgi:ribosomal protein L44E
MNIDQKDLNDASVYCPTCKKEHSFKVRHLTAEETQLLKELRTPKREEHPAGLLPVGHSHNHVF